MKSRQITITDCEAMTFCGTFRKNVARIEWATHHERLYNACVWLKKIHFANNCPKMPNIPLGHLQKLSSGGFLLKAVLENFAKFTGNLLYWSLFLIRLQSPSPQLYLKKRLQHRRFLMNLVKFSRAPPGDCLVFHYFKRGFSLCISLCRIFS